MDKLPDADTIICENFIPDPDKDIELSNNSYIYNVSFDRFTQASKAYSHHMIPKAAEETFYDDIHGNGKKKARSRIGEMAPLLQQLNTIRACFKES